MDDILDLSHIPPLYTSAELLKKKAEGKVEAYKKAAQIASNTAKELQRIARQLRKNPEVAERFYDKAKIAEAIAAKINSKES